MKFNTYFFIEFLKQDRNRVMIHLNRLKSQKFTDDTNREKIRLLKIETIIKTFPEELL
jgi:hypothetical protein